MIIDRSGAAGKVVGVITGVIVGGLIAAYVIFPIMIGHTLTEFLRLLSRWRS